MAQCTQYARGLIQYGIKPGDFIAVASANRVEWNILDIAVQQIGAVLVPLYPNISSKDYAYILNDCGAVLMFVGNEEIALKINEIRDNASKLKEVFAFDRIAGTTHWTNLLLAYESIPESEVNDRMEQVKEDDLATIIYTSGTTGNPKGVMLSHKNILSNVLACVEPIPADNQSRVLTFLPICHIYERMLHYLYMYIGCAIYFAESMDTIGENIKEVKPHVFSAVPRLIEKVFDKIMSKGEELKGIKKVLFYWAVKLADKYNDVNNSAWYRCRLSIARKLIFKKWQEALGGNVNAIASGSAALQPRLARIFLAAGIPILEGYGMSETSPVISVNCHSKGIRVGTVGALIEGVEVKFEADGEILVKGPNVMLGYFNNPEATNEVFTEDGWLKTGDIGTFQDEVFLKITDRKKEIFKTSGGKYIVPQYIENTMKESRFVAQIMVVGENQKFPAAFIVPNFSFVKEWAERHDMDFTGMKNEEIVENPKVIARIEKEVAEMNGHLGSWEQLKKIKLIPQEFTIEGEELTPTLKLRRKNILAKYNQAFLNLYQ
jgi:long-chain acyl-CoA synthetase